MKSRSRRAHAVLRGYAGMLGVVGLVPSAWCAQESVPSNIVIVAVDPRVDTSRGLSLRMDRAIKRRSGLTGQTGQRADFTSHPTLRMTSQWPESMETGQASGSTNSKSVASNVGTSIEGESIALRYAETLVQSRAVRFPIGLAVGRLGLRMTEILDVTRRSEEHLTSANNVSASRSSEDSIKLSGRAGGPVGLAQDMPLAASELLSESNDAPGSVAGGTDQPDRQVKRKPRWRMAPIGWGASLGANYGLSQGDIGGEHPTRTVTNTYQFNWRGNSFVRAPWFALIRGNFSIGVGSSEQENELDGTRTTSDGDSLTGGVGVDLFPQSHFPFSASIDVSDSRSKEELVAIDRRSTIIRLRQDYRPPNGKGTYFGTYSRSIDETADGAQYTSDDLAASYITQMGKHNLTVNGNLNWNGSNAQNAGQASRFQFDIRHNWRPEARYHLDDSASYAETRSESASSESGNRFLQLNSTFGWTPDTEKPMQVTGGARVFVFDNTTDDASMATLLNTFASVNYAWSRKLNLASSASLNRSDSNGNGLTSANLVGSANYNGDSIVVAGFSYGWGGNFGFSSSWVSDSESVSNLNAGLSHGLTRTWTLSQTSAISLSLNQGGGVNATNSEGSEIGRSLNHSANISWSFAPIDSARTTFSLGASDGRNWGGDQQHFRMYNFQANGGMNLSRNASFNINLTAQSSWSSTRSEQIEHGVSVFTEDEHRSESAYGSLTYQHNRPFGINNLRYSLSYSVNTMGLDEKNLPDPLFALDDRVDQSLEQRIDYGIGRVRMNLTHTLAEQDGQKSSRLFLSVSRAFGR